MADAVEVYDLKHDVVVDKGKKTESLLTQLEVREPTARDMRSLPVDVAHKTWGHQLELIANLTGQPVRIINDLHGEDFVALAELVQKKLVGGR